MNEPRVLGVDFSGAERPGESVWITEGSLCDGALVVGGCRSGRAAFGTSEREAIMSGLVEMVHDGDRTTVAGFDFPFGLPRAVVEELDGPETWRATVEWVLETVADAETFTERCKAAARAATGGDRTYLRRMTDDPVGAKSPYHFITYHQAYHGMTDVLAPLVTRGVEVAPMTRKRTSTPDEEENVSEERPTVVEAYPAGTLRRLGVPHKRYKTDTPEARAARERILDGLVSGGGGESSPAVVLKENVRKTLLNDVGGDALDSLVAAAATARAVDGGFAVDCRRYDPLEGYVYI